MRQIKASSQVKKDLKKVSRNPRHKAGVEVLRSDILPCLQKGETLPEKYRDYELINVQPRARDCHVLNDLVLLYRIDAHFVYLIRLGTHAELFG